MTCLNMFNNEKQQHQALYSTLSPRISFSNDFADSQKPLKLDNIYREAPVSSEFEFSVPNYNMIPADQIFSKGKIIPLRENRAKATLRDELLVVDNGFEDVPPRTAKGTSGWKQRLGLKRSHVGPNKCDNNLVQGSLESIDEMKAKENIA